MKSGAIREWFFIHAAVFESEKQRGNFLWVIELDHWRLFQPAFCFGIMKFSTGYIIGFRIVLIAFWKFLVIVPSWANFEVFLVKFRPFFCLLYLCFLLNSLAIRKIPLAQRRLSHCFADKFFHFCWVVSIR